MYNFVLPEMNAVPLRILKCLAKNLMLKDFHVFSKELVTFQTGKGKISALSIQIQIFKSSSNTFFITEIQVLD